MKKQDDSDMLRLDPRRQCTATNGGLFVSPGQGSHPHRVIDSYELIVVRKGTLHLEEAGRPLVTGPNQALLLWPGRPHSGTQLYAPDLTFYWMHFRLLPQRSTLREPPIELHQTTTLCDPERVSSLLHQFLDEQERASSDTAIRDLLLALVLCEVARSRYLVPASSDGAFSLAHRALGYIRSHHHRAISTADVAEAMRVSSDHLGRVFRARHGHTVVEAIHQQRIRSARRQLIETNLTIDEVAAGCGFADPGYFRRVFRRHTGTTPSQYRRLHARLHLNTW